MIRTLWRCEDASALTELPTNFLLEVVIVGVVIGVFTHIHIRASSFWHFAVDDLF